MRNPFRKGSIEVDVKRQAWVRHHPKPAEPKEKKYTEPHGLKVKRRPSAILRHQQGIALPPPPYPPLESVRQVHGLSDDDRSRHDDNGLRRAQTTHRQQRYEGIPNSSRRGDEGRSRHDSRGLGHAQSTRSQNPFDDEYESGVEPIHESGISELGGLPISGERHGGLRHHGSRGPSRGQHDDRGRSRAQSNAGHGGLGQSRYDFAPPTDRMTAQKSVGHGHRGSQR